METRLWPLRLMLALTGALVLALLVIQSKSGYYGVDLLVIRPKANSQFFDTVESSSSSSLSSSSSSSVADEEAISLPKYILVYTTLFGDTRWPGYEDRPDYLKELKCPATDCLLTYDRAKLSMSAAVVFHARDMPSADTLREVSRTFRPPWQRWAYFNAESPAASPDATPLDGLFNLTMTYRLDSDVHCPYRKFRKLERNESRPDPNINYAKGKSKMAAWMANNCVGHRIRAVRMLEKHGIQVSTAGACSAKFSNKLKCQNRDCYEDLRHHKFYLSFENSFCEDYITEKYWTNAMEYNLVPIVLGGANYSNPSVAVPNSFINVQDFKDYKQLAEYMQLVASNDTLYNSYFAWKQHYVLEELNQNNQWPCARPVLCGLCSIAHDRRYPQKVYDKLSDIWSLHGACNQRGSTHEFNERS